jgi:hypothetical protein
MESGAANPATSIELRLLIPPTTTLECRAAPSVELPVAVTLKVRRGTTAATPEVVVVLSLARFVSKGRAAAQG